MTTEQAIQDVAMIARNGIDRVIELERDKARLQAEVTRLRELSDEMFATIVAALSLAPQDCGAYGVLDDAIKNLQPKWIRRYPIAMDMIAMRLRAVLPLGNSPHPGRSAQLVQGAEMTPQEMQKEVQDAMGAGLRYVRFQIPKGGTPKGFPRGEVLNEQVIGGQVLMLREYDPEKVKAWMIKNGLWGKEQK